MGFYSVEITDTKQPGVIHLLYPSGIVKEIFVVGTEFSSLELKKTIMKGIQSSMDRLEEKGGSFYLAGIPAMVEILKKEIDKIEGGHTYKVTESGDAMETIRKKAIAGSLAKS